MDIHVLWISVFNYPCFYGYPFKYPWISIDIHAVTCYGSSIQGCQISIRAGLAGWDYPRILLPVTPVVRGVIIYCTILGSLLMESNNGL